MSDNHIKTHVVDILGSTKGRDQPIMKMDKAVELVRCLGKEVLASDKYVFFDPFCKAGEILLATALMSTLYRKGKPLMPQEEVAKELYESNRYFALAPDERHYYLSSRTFYGNERSHDLGKNHNIRNGAYLSENDGRLNREKFKQELDAMLEYIKEKAGDKKIVAVGNPPYQEEDFGHGRSARPIYNIFIDLLIKSCKVDQFVFVIPSRWFSGGKGLDQFRSEMITSNKIKQIFYFENPHTIFPTVEIRGGVCFLHWDKSGNGNALVTNGKKSNNISLDTYDIIVPHIEAYSILSKVFEKSDRFLDEVVWPRKPFGLAGNFFKVNKKWPKGNVQCLCGMKKINKISPEIVGVNVDKINHYKVAFPEASGGGKGKRDKILPRPDHFFILERGQISTETYSVASSFESREMAENLLIFLQSYLARFLLGLRKPTQHTSRKTFSWVPAMENSRSWNDRELFEHFGITKEEERYIVEKVDYWTA